MMTEFGVYQHGIGWTYEQLRDYWLEADRLGFEYGWMMDNVVAPNPNTGEMLPVFETWTVLPALAEATTNIRMGPMVTPCRRRHPALLAKITTTFDRISNGRLELGLGPGDDPMYFEPWGMTYPKTSIRIEMLQEEIIILKKMWTEAEADFQGKYYTLAKATNDPKPIQTPHPPIWIGLVLGKKVMPRLAAEYGDNVNIYNASDRATRYLLEAVERNCEELDRDFKAMCKSRSVNVIMTETVIDQTQQAIEVDQHGSIPHVIGTFEELAKERSSSLDEQLERLRKTRNKKAEYSRITERHIIGHPTQVAEELEEVASDGFDQLIIHGLDSVEELQRFADEVKPYVGSS